MYVESPQPLAMLGLQEGHVVGPPKSVVSLEVGARHVARNRTLPCKLLLSLVVVASPGGESNAAVLLIGYKA